MAGARIVLRADGIELRLRDIHFGETHIHLRTKFVACQLSHLIIQKLARGHEYASYITNAWLGHEPFRFNGNVLNTGRMVTNLPQDCCVEVPVLASRGGLQAMYVGDLPRQVVPITALSATCETMAVEAAITGNPHLVFQAIASDPLTAAVLSLAEIREMVNAMLQQNRKYLPQFKTFTA